jgi:hypothetical protein
MGLHVAKDRHRTLISRTGRRAPDGRQVDHAWGALVEERARGHQVSADPAPPIIALTGLPAIVVLLAGLEYLGAFAAVLACGLTMLVTGALVFRFARRRAPRPRVTAEAEGRELTTEAERAAFDRAMATADRVAATWPALDGLVDVPEAETLLAEALWEIAGVLARRQELTAVLAQLTRPDFAALSPADATAARLQTQVRATKEALSAVEIDLARREASLRRAEEAGRGFIREREMREAIRAAERSLASTADPALTSTAADPALASAGGPTPAFTARPAPDPAAELAEQTQLVIAAYRELTTTLHPEDA